VTLTARPTTYNGIEMRSRTEARFAAFLDEHNFTWTYEPRAFASAKGQYLPDFRLAFGPHATRTPVAYVEIKGTVADERAEAEILDRMSIIWDSEPEALLVLAASIYEHGLLLYSSRSWPDKHWQGGYFGRCGVCLASGITRKLEEGGSFSAMFCTFCGTTLKEAHLLPSWAGDLVV
jgi:hypothetical protein